MQYTTGGKLGASFVCKGILWGLTFFLFLGFLCFASADSAGSLSGRVWNDLNNDGLIDADEPGVAGVTLTLKRGNTPITATSDAQGAFLFTSLADGSYTLSVALPDSMLYARYRKEGGSLRSVMTGDDPRITRPFVIRDAAAVTGVNIGLVDSAIVRGIAFLDLNYNGNYDEGEPPYQGVTVEIIRNASDRSLGKVVTGEDGGFFLDTVRAGNYRLRAILPDNGSIFSKVPDSPGVFSNLLAARPGRRENAIASIDTENSMVYEYYIGIAIGGEISGTVFTDKNYTGVLDRGDSKLGSLKVELVDAGGTPVAQTATSAKGVYTFQDVMPGEYRLRFERRDGYTFTKYRPQEASGNSARLTQAGDTGETELFSFSMGQSLSDLNAGLVQSATLGGVFFHDANDNGLMDEGEGGFTDGQVRLLSQDGEIDLIQPIHADGSYYFSGVVPTEYTLYYLLPVYAEIAKVANGGNTLQHQGAENTVTGLTLKAKKDYTQPLVGAVKLGTFTGRAFTDSNANGIQDAGELPLAGVTVTLSLQKDPQQTAEAITGADGLFAITGLRPEKYTLSLQLPDGMIFASDILASDIALNPDNAYTAPIPFSTLINRADNAIGAVEPATLQAQVWLDENRSGMQDAGERMLSGMEYTLYDEVHQETVATAIAGEDGTAVFRNVRPSAYTVSFTLPDNAQPVTGNGTFAQNGSTMRHSGIVVGPDETFSAISGGLVYTTSIGGTVKADQQNGQIPVADAQVRLYLQGDEKPLKSVSTDEQGVYRFDGLWPGSYVIEVVRPGGLVFIRPDDPALQAGDSIIRHMDDTTGSSDPFPLAMAQDQLSHAVLLTIPAKVGNLVWLDENENGLIDGTEPMIGGVTVNLLQNDAVVYTTVSNEWGYYEFPDVYPGEYTLEAAAYPALDITTPVPELRMISSCLVTGDGTLAASDPFSVTSASVNFFCHLGYILRDGAEMPPAIAEGAHQIWNQPE